MSKRERRVLPDSAIGRQRQADHGSSVYSTSWFSTFAGKISSSSIQAEVSAVASHIPVHAFPRVLELGCGTGRVLCPLEALGYDVTGLDITFSALQVARRTCPNGRFVALDQRHVGRLKWTFDAALVLWNSIGFGTVEEDQTTLSDVHQVLRPGGRLLLDLYNPVWLQRHDMIDHVDPRGATVTRQLRGRRVFHTISYVGGGVDRIDFNVYDPAAIRRLLIRAGFDVAPPLVWWKPAAVTAGDARYQLVATTIPGRPGAVGIGRRRSRDS
jgi:SAM-dependent methyltransferase